MPVEGIEPTLESARTGFSDHPGPDFKGIGPHSEHFSILDNGRHPAIFSSREGGLNTALRGASSRTLLKRSFRSDHSPVKS
jgi:hypothetical protein